MKKIDITFRLNNLCNFQCEYCHWYKYSHFKTEDIIESLKNIFKFYKLKNASHNILYFHGGEPSFHPDFHKIVKYIYNLKKIYNINLDIEIQTNLSFDGELYKSVQPMITKYSVTFHYNELKKKNLIEKFIKNVDYIGAENIRNFDIMLEKMPVEETESFYKILKTEILPRAKMAEKSEMIYGFCHFDGNSKTAPLHKKFYDENNITENVYFWEDVMDKPKTTNELFLEGLNNEGCLCDAGYRYFTINGDGNVFRCGIGMTNWLRIRHKQPYCGETEPICNIITEYDKLIDYSNSRKPCQWNYCGGDFYVERHKTEDLFKN